MQNNYDSHFTIRDTHHQVDDSCPVTDEVLEQNYFRLSHEERIEKDNKSARENIAIDLYVQILSETGNPAKAQKAYHDYMKK